MTRKRKEQQQQNNLISIRQKSKRKLINSDYLLDINPLTKNQIKLFESYKSGKNLVAHGCAGTGKTFITLYNALADVLNENTPYEKIYIVRSLVSTRDIGFLPGTYEEKSDIYQMPYKQMVRYMFQMP